MQKIVQPSCQRMQDLIKQMNTQKIGTCSSLAGLKEWAQQNNQTHMIKLMDQLASHPFKNPKEIREAFFSLQQALAHEQTFESVETLLADKNNESVLKKMNASWQELDESIATIMEQIIQEGFSIEQKLAAIEEKRRKKQSTLDKIKDWHSQIEALAIDTEHTLYKAEINTKLKTSKPIDSPFKLI